MTQAEERAAVCAHNFIFITRSSYRKAPYYFCSRCGEKRDHIKGANNAT